MKAVADVEAEAIAELVPDSPPHPAFGFRSGKVKSSVVTRNRLKYVDDGETWREQLSLPDPTS